MVWGLGYRSLGFRVYVLGFRFRGEFGVRFWGFKSVAYKGFRIQGFRALGPLVLWGSISLEVYFARYLQGLGAACGKDASRPRVQSPIPMSY